VPAADDKAAYATDLQETELRMRAPQSHAGRVAYWLGIATALIHIYYNTLGTISENWFAALHFGLFGLLVALIYPLRPGATSSGRAAVLGLDIAVGLLALGVGVYLIAFEEALFLRGQNFMLWDWVMALAAVLLAIELTRRTSGWVIPGLIIAGVSYVGWWGQYVPGVFQFPGLSWETVFFRAYFSSDGMFGSIARISATVVFMFILFGAFLLKSGAGDLIIALARAVIGRFIGGPGLVAVAGSSMMGSISGSAVANAASTGVITIPMMKKAGFSSRFSGAVEGAASTGGQLMPPIMGAGAFIMASYTQIPYLQIIAVAALPALLYFLSVAYFVRIQARRSGLTSADEEHLPLGEVLRTGAHLLLPLAVLVGLLIYGFTPTYAAGFAILAVIAASWLSSRPMGLRDILDALALGARNMATTAMLLIAVGIVVNVISTTGIGNTFSLMVTDWSQGSLLIMMVLIALASLVLGMGLPVTAAYIVLGTLSAPALNDLISQQTILAALVSGEVSETARAVFMLVAPEQAAALGQPMTAAQASALLALVPPEMTSTLREQFLSPATITATLLSAHMIIFWLSQDSNVTPPVCLATFAAATIAKSPPMRTGFTAWKLAKGIYIVPLLFAYTPFLHGDWETAFMIFAFAALGLYAFAGAMEGYLEGPVSWRLRPLLVVAGAALLWPELDLLLRAGAVLLLLVVFFMTRVPPGRAAEATATP
jgi:TRAP transporter 4TM/12TM fusion protein